MKYIILILSVLTLVGCSQPDEIGKDNSNESENSSEVESNSSMDSNKVSARFHKLHFRLGIEDVNVTGQAKSTNDEIFYRVEQEDEKVIDETKVTLDEPDKDGWSEIDFTFNITSDIKDSEEELYVIFYTKDEKGNEINPNYLSIDLNLQYNNANE